jgi:hypothetical protein
MQSKILLPLFYLPPISWFSAFVKNESEIILEQMEHFPKQTYRNRMEILGANGKLVLSIPIKKAEKKPLKDIEISFLENWKTQHWKSIQSAYQASPYFEYYQDDLKKIYENDLVNLIDFNLNALSIIQKLLKINIDYQLNSVFENEFQGTNLRNYFSSKQETNIPMESYYQVFSDKFDFQKDLSILDLLCNKGPESATYLSNITNFF